MGNHKFNPFARGTTIGPSGVKDRLGRPLKEGDVVLLAVPPPPLGLTWVVRAIRPNLDPAAQANTGTMDLIATMSFAVPLTGQAINEVVRIAEVEQALPAALGEAEGGPAEDPPAPIVES